MPPRQTREPDVVLAAQDIGEVVQPVNQYDLEIMFACICLDPAYLRDARLAIRNHYFMEGSETQYAILWQAICDCTDAYGQLAFHVILGRVIQLCDRIGGALLPEMRDELIRQDHQGILFSAMCTPTSPALSAFGREILMRFLHERTVVNPLRRMLSHGYAGAYAGDLSKFLEQVTEHQQRLQTLQVVPRLAVSQSIGDPLDPPIKFCPTGVEFIDTPIGGQRAGDVNGIIGVTGGGKTTLAVHMSVQTAKVGWQLRDGKRPPFVIYATVEEPAKKIRPLINSAAYQIRRDKLATLADWGTLSTRDTLEDYERRLVSAGGEVLCETERWQMNQHWLSATYELLDLSGSAEFPQAGKEYVAGLAAGCERLILQRQQDLSTVYVDWAGLLCARYMAVQNMEQSAMRQLLAGFADECRTRIAERFNCTVWVFHQARGDAASGSPGKLLTHADALDCKAFAFNMAICGAIGPPDKTTDCRILNFSKVRYVSQQKTPPIVLRIHPHFPLLSNVSETFGIANSQIALLSDLAATNGLTTTPAAGAAGQAQTGPPGHERNYSPTDPEG